MPVDRQDRFGSRGGGAPDGPRCEGLRVCRFLRRARERSGPAMVSWNDPVLWVGVILGVGFLFRAGRSFLRDLEYRRAGKARQKRHARMLLADYRVRYGREEGLLRLQEDLRSARARLESLAARWKEYQRRTEEAIQEAERRSWAEQERRAREAFLAEAQRLRALKEVGQRLRR